MWFQRSDWPGDADQELDPVPVSAAAQGHAGADNDYYYDLSLLYKYNIIILQVQAGLPGL